MTLEQFFYMGGYAFYVWTAYALAFVVLLANLLNPLFHERRLMRDLARRMRRAQRIPQRSQTQRSQAPRSQAQGSRAQGS